MLECVKKEISVETGWVDVYLTRKEEPSDLHAVVTFFFMHVECKIGTINTPHCGFEVGFFCC